MPITLDDALAEFDQHFAGHNFSTHFKAAACIAEYISQLESALMLADKNGYLLNNCRMLAEKYANMPADEE